MADLDETLATRACNSCRQRKTWCDRRLPGCNKCQRAGRECSGYERDTRTVFVNLGLDNVRTHKKKLLSRAIAETKARERCQREGSMSDSSEPSSIESLASSGNGAWSVEDLQHAVKSIALKQPDFRAGNFRDNLAQLWFGYQTTYCTTQETWPPGYAQLQLRNEAMDLALVALSALKLSLNCEDKNPMRMLSYAAYGESLKIFKEQVAKSDKASNLALLAVTSTIFGFWEACQTPVARIIEMGWGTSGHLQGAAEIARQAGPLAFCKDGYHEIFRKLREMTISHSVAHTKRTFFSEPRWLLEPWYERKKTWRDRLWDLAAEMCAVNALPPSTGGEVKLEDTDQPDEITRANKLSKMLEMQSKFTTWHEHWLEIGCPEASQSTLFNQSQVAGYSELHPVEYPSILFTFCEVDYLSFQVILGMHMMELCSHQAKVDLVDVREHCKLAVRTIEQALKLPAFDQYVIQGNMGITEGRCRALLPCWVLREYRKRRLS